MDFFIHKLSSGAGDSLSHLHFEKYSCGTFKDKAIVQCKFAKGIYSISTTSEYANEIVRFLGEELGSGSAAAEGVIISTKPLPPDIKYEGISQFMGVKKYAIRGTFTGNQIISVCDSVPRAFIALSFKTPSTELKIKPKAPKSAKPGSDSKNAPKVDFCKLKTTNAALVKSLFFDVGDFKQAEAKHNFEIISIDVPADEKDPVKMRERAIRKGKLIRILTVDGTQHRKEFPLSA